MEHKSKYEVIDELTAEVLGLMEDLYQRDRKSTRLNSSHP